MEVGTHQGRETRKDRKRGDPRDIINLFGVKQLKKSWNKTFKTIH